MKTKLTFLTLFLACSCLTAIAQQKLHVGVEIGPKQEHFKFEDPNGILYKKEYKHTIKGLSISYELNKNYTLESGFYSTPRAENINFTGNALHGWGNPDRMFQIPLKVNRNLLSLTTKLQLRGIAGISYVYNPEGDCPSGECYSGSEASYSKQNDSYFEADIYTLNKHLWLSEVGASINYKLKPKLNLTFTNSYSFGFKPITRIYTEYHHDENAVYKALAYSKGSSTNYLLKLSYQLFDFSRTTNTTQNKHEDRKTTTSMRPTDVHRSSLKALHKFYLNPEFGLGIEFQSKQDQHNLVQSVKRFGASPYGLTFRYELDDKYAFEAGMIKEPLMQEVRINNIDFKSTFEAGDRTTSYLRVPLRLNLKALNFGERISLHVYGGSSYLWFPLETGFRYGTWSGDFNKEGVAWRKDHYVLEKSSWLLEGGTSLSYRLSNKFTVDANVNYLHGFNDLTRTDIKYKSHGGTTQEAEVYSKGTKLNFTLGVRYKVMELRKLNN